MDTATLRELVTAHGPFASVYFDDTHDTEDAAKQLELRWRELRRQLSDQGAPEPTLAAMDEAVRRRAPAVGTGSGRALVAASGEVLLDRRLPGPPARPVARVSGLPYLVPLAEYGELPPTHVVAVVDRIGADITAVDERGAVIDARTVEGTEAYMHKVPSGGWSHRNIQQHTEELIKQNIDKAAEHVATVARQAGAALVILAGESQARKALLAALPESVAGLATEVQSGGRKPGSGEEELDREIERLLTDATDGRLDSETERFTAALAQPTGLAVQGLEAVTTALREHNVETLLVGEADAAEVLAGPDPVLLAVQEEELHAHGVDEFSRVRADEALVVAATTVSADVIHVGDRVDLTEGFGAILRHD